MKYTYEDFLEIVKTLRSEHGCPWDKAQTHMSLRSCMVEETYEVLQAIKAYDESGSFENLREELGDVLFMVVLQAQIASEERIFTIEDVINEISEKMVYRHPHVFDDPEKYDPNDALVNWDSLKKREKQIRKEKEEAKAAGKGNSAGNTVGNTTGNTEQEPTYTKEDYASKIARLEQITEQLKHADFAQDRDKIADLEDDLLSVFTQISQVCNLPIKKILANRILNEQK